MCPSACCGRSFSGCSRTGLPYFNANFSHDALYQLTADDDLWQVSLGRFLQPVWRLVRGDVSAPWLLGALSLVCIALAARLVIELMGMRRPLWKVLTCALMTVSQTVTMLNATYGPWVDAFMLSMLLAVVSVWLLERGGGRGLCRRGPCAWPPRWRFIRAMSRWRWG